MTERADSQANGIMEQKHFDTRESLMKTCNNEHSKWVHMPPLIFGLTKLLSVS